MAISIGAIFDCCVNAGAQPQLRHLRAAFLSADVNYRQKASELQFYLMPQHSLSEIDVANATGLYRNRLSKVGSACRRFYDAIMTDNQLKQCKYCGHREARTLDHYLPQAFYPDLSINPSNLVPACTECNGAKGDYVPECAEDQLMHPGFENWEARWLYATVEMQAGIPELSFSVQPPRSWDSALIARSRKSFEVLRLGNAYALQALVDFYEVRGYLEDIYASKGSTGVREYAKGISESAARIGENSWKRAAYEAYEKCDEFCNGGFVELAAQC